MLLIIEIISLNLAAIFRREALGIVHWDDRIFHQGEQKNFLRWFVVDSRCVVEGIVEGLIVDKSFRG